MFLIKYTVLILALVMLLGEHDASLFVLAKKNKKKKKIEYPEISSHKRPSDIKAELYCESCYAVVEQSITHLYSSTKESDIFLVLEEICKHDKYKGYKFAPPYMSDTCDQMISDWEPQLEKLLLERNPEAPLEKLQEKFCGNDSVTRSCHGIDRNEIKKEKIRDSIIIDGKKVALDDLDPSLLSKPDDLEKLKKVAAKGREEDL